MPLSAALLVAAGLSAGAPPTGTIIPWVQPELNPREAAYGVQWKAELGRFELLATQPEEWSHPCLSPDGARAYVATRSGRLEARAMADGAVLWKHPQFGDVGSDMLEYRDTLVVGVDSDLVGLSRSLGTEKWRVRVGGRVGGRLARSGSIVVAPVRPNGFVAVDLEDAERLWQIKRSTPDGLTIRGQAAAAIDAERNTAYLGFSDGMLIAVALDSGTTRWQVALGDSSQFFADVDGTPVLLDGGKSLLAAAYNTGGFILDAANGAVREKLEHLSRITALAPAGRRILASTGRGQVLGLDPSNFAIVWRYKLHEGAPSEATVIDGELAAVVTSRGPMSILDIETGRPVQLVDSGPGASVPPSAVGRNLLLISDGGLVLGMRRGRPGALLLH